MEDVEIQEWLESLDSVLESSGPEVAEAQASGLVRPGAVVPAVEVHADGEEDAAGHHDRHDEVGNLRLDHLHQG